MSDRDEILNLMARYSHTYDDGDLEQWVQLFAHGSYTFMGKTFTGVQEIGDWIIPTSVRRGTRHVIFNVYVEVDGDQAQAKSDFITVPRDATGVFKVDSPEAVWGRYDDTFHRIDGRWWFGDRVVTVDNESQMVAGWAWMRKNAAVYIERSEELYQLSAHEEIRWLISEYCHRYDAGDYEGWAKLFERGRMKVFDTWYAGPAELIPFALRTASPGVSAGKHICFNSSIRVDGERAEAVTDYWYVPRDITGRLNPVDPQCIWGEYRDTYQVVDGQWMFDDRVVVMYDEDQIGRNYAVLLARWGADSGS